VGTLVIEKNVHLMHRTNDIHSWEEHIQNWGQSDALEAQK
jgi:hypothetical protein